MHTNTRTLSGRAHSATPQPRSLHLRAWVRDYGRSDGFVRLGLLHGTNYRPSGTTSLARRPRAGARGLIEHLTMLTADGEFVEAIFEAPLLPVLRRVFTNE